jgi:CRP/FNR family transcriptional regulator
MRTSALVQRLERYVALSPAERDALDWAERRETKVPAGGRLLSIGEESDTLYVVQLGWFHAATRLQTGGRQILRFHFPGDLMGTSSIAWASAVHDFTAVSDAIVSELSKVNLGRLFREQPRLAGMLYAMAAAENVALSDRLTSVGRMDSIERVSTLILDVLARLRVTAGGVVDSFDFPLTQTDIGDAVGLTKVHVSRTLGKMEDRGLIERVGKRVKVLDEARMIAETGFVDRYKEIDSSWLAPAAA